jgi:hypothetical protein
VTLTHHLPLEVLCSHYVSLSPHNRATHPVQLVTKTLHRNVIVSFFFFFVSEFFLALFSSPPPRVEEQYSELSIFNLNKPTGWMLLLLLVIKMMMNVFDDGD